MKSFLVIAALVAACHAQADDPMQDPHSKECAEQCSQDTGMDIIKLMKKGNCFMKCYSTKAGFLNDKGELNTEALKERFKMMDPTKLSETGSKCAAENKQDDMFERMSATTKCIFASLSPQ